VAFGMATLLICALSPRLPFSRIDIPGATFFAGIAYSVYLSHKLVIHFAAQLAARHDLAPTSLSAIILVQVLIYLGGVVLFLGAERPFLLLRHRIARVPDA
jgi:peptidoglycan/LPS O-acetylase OafA/YrhL